MGVKMISRSIILAIVTLLPMSSTYAATPVRSVEDLYRMCETPITSPEHAVCLGYISAVGDLLKFLSANERLHAEAEPIGMCGSPTYGALVEAFVSWSKENPRRWASHRMEGVMQALMEHWPCK
jgi:Ssp1 endopeptidase immunity protein Rap1a